MRDGDSVQHRKERGAFFTPPAIADFLADWALSGGPGSVVLDPTCGEAVFLLAAGRRLAAAGRTQDQIARQLLGYDLHSSSLEWSHRLLREEHLGATLQQGDFFAVPPPTADQNTRVDAVIGNPPFVRYQRHIGSSREISKEAALRQGVRLSNLASSWAAMLIHSCGFLKAEGKLAMVLPAELLTVGYAEPVRAWLKARFEQVHLVFLEKLQFADASEKVVLLLASGSGGCDAFSLYFLRDATDLVNVRPMSGQAATVAPSGKWSNLQLTNGQRSTLTAVASEHFVDLTKFGRPILGTVTGANAFFLMTEAERAQRNLREGLGQVKPICPPQSKHIKGVSYTSESWTRARDAGERVWLFCPDRLDTDPAVIAYKDEGEERQIHKGYKCSIRNPWWVPPMVTPPDIFFTYMSHRHPRLIANDAGISMMNSMLGLHLASAHPEAMKRALPLLSLNSVTLLAAELMGRAYGNGLLKLEPGEASRLPVANAENIKAAWEVLGPDFNNFQKAMLLGDAEAVVARVDDVLLRQIMRIQPDQVDLLTRGLSTVRGRRLMSNQ